MSEEHMGLKITNDDCKERALGMYLADWEDDETNELLSYDNIVIAFKRGHNIENKDGDNIVTVWEPFEHYPLEYVAEQIEDYYHSICRFVGLKP